MYICYFDESGDPGIPSATLKSPTNWFVLGCVLMHDSDWLDTLNALVDLRREPVNLSQHADRLLLPGC